MQFSILFYKLYKYIIVLNNNRASSKIKIFTIVQYKDFNLHFKSLKLCKEQNKGKNKNN